MATTDGNGSSNGKANGASHEAIEAEIHEIPAAPPEVAELAEACVRFVKGAVGVAPDYTSDTLPLLDHYVKTSTEAAKARPEAAILVLRALAAYLGEVARHSFDGYWHLAGADPETWEVRMRRVFLTFSPYAIAAVALFGGDEDPGIRVDDAEREELAARLAALPPVDADEYTLPTTRFEVLQIAMDMLQAKADAAGLGDMVLGDEDYDD